MNKLKETFSFHITGMRLLKIVHEIDSAFLPLLLLDTVLQTSATFLGLFFSAELIDSLLDGDFHQAFLWAFSIVFINLLTGTASRILQKFYQVMNTKCTLAFQVKLREKALSLSYETIENPQTMDKILFSERTAAMHGGLGQIAVSYQELLFHLLKLLCSLFLVILLCLKRGRQQIFLLTFLASPALSSLLLVLVFLGTTLLSTRTMKKYAALEKDVFRDHTRIENKSSYLLQGVFCNYKAGMPIRIFQMEDMLL